MAELYDLPVIGRISLVEENKNGSPKFVARMKEEGYKIFAQTNESMKCLKELVVDYLRKRKEEYLNKIFELDDFLIETNVNGAEKIFKKYKLNSKMNK